MDFASLKRVSWYPGHMLQAERQMREKLKLIDVIVEVVDARAPRSGRNRAFLPLVEHRAHVVALAKSDLAEDAVTQDWARHFEAEGTPCIYYHHRQRQTLPRLVKTLQRADAQAREARGATSPRLRNLRAMIIGLPNVGKSSLINLAVGKKSAKTGPRPGVTRHQQWLSLGDDVELLDTPGVFMARVDGSRTGLNLGLMAAMKEEHIGEELLAEYLFYLYAQRDDAPWVEAYGCPTPPASHHELLHHIATSSGKLLKGGEPDTVEAARRILREYRAGRFGPFSIERPDDPAEPDEA